MRRLMSYRSVFEDFVARADGRIFNTAGDAILAEFPSAVDALRTAIDIQELLRTRNLSYPPSRHMVFRIGLTIGDVMEREGDLLGDGVNIAARLQGLATPGGICVSRSVHEQVANKLSVLFSDLGPQDVKNIPQPVHAYRVELEKGSPDQTLTAHARRQSTARPLQLLIAFSVLLVGVGALGSFVILNKPWSRQGVANQQTAADVTSPTSANAPVKSRSERLWEASPRTLLGARFVAAEVPFVCDECREKIGRALNGQPNHTALAISWDGLYYWALNRSTAAEARLSALAQCLDAKRRACFVYAVDNQIVWSEPPPSVPVKPWFDPRTKLPVEFDEFSKIPNFLPEQKQRMAEFYPMQNDSRALVLGDMLQWSMTGGVQTDEEAARTALERCGYITHSPCRVIAIGNSFVVPPASFSINTVAAPAFAPSSSSSTGPVYSLTGPPFLPGNIPFICDECRDQITKGLYDRPMHSAVAISLEGRFWYVWGRDSAEQARTIVLGNCIGANQRMCFVFAVDGQLVSTEKSPPLPATPWFTNDPHVAHPLDIDAIPHLSDSQKRAISDLYSRATPPKAIAVGNGSWGVASSFGYKPLYRTEMEAARIALERCGFVTQAPCRIVAINDNSVVRPGSQ